MADAVMVSRKALRTLAGYATVFDDPGFAVGTWYGGQPDDRGVIQMPYMIFSDEVTQFIDDMSRVEIVRAFDWVRWAETVRGRELLTSPAASTGASAEELSNLVTAVVRAERFGEGQIEAAFERGVLQAAATRAAGLLED